MLSFCAIVIFSGYGCAAKKARKAEAERKKNAERFEQLEKDQKEFRKKIN